MQSSQYLEILNCDLKIVTDYVILHHFYQYKKKQVS